MQENPIIIIPLNITGREVVEMTNDKIYMDYASSTPVDPIVLEAMLPYFCEIYGNASNIHSFGRTSREGIEKAREQVAGLIGAEAGEIIFTSGGTEADNIGIIGYLQGSRKEGTHIMTSTIEHPAVLRTFQYLEKKGYEVTYIPVDSEGIIDIDEYKASFRENTSLVSIIFGNNEIGVVQDIKELARIAHEHGAVLHTDAVQAYGKIPINAKEMGIDLLSLSGHKIYAPKGIGALYISKGLRVSRINHGGSHERGLRSGTENVPSIVGLGKAAELAGQRMAEDGAREMKMRDHLFDEILAKIPDTHINGHRTKRLPNNVNIRFAHIEGEAILLNLDYYGIAVTTGSACSSASLDPSHVMLAIGLTAEEAHGSMRLTLGHQTTDEEVERVLEVLPGVIEKLRKMSPLG